MSSAMLDIDRAREVVAVASTVDVAAATGTLHDVALGEEGLFHPLTTPDMEALELAVSVLTLLAHGRETGAFRRLEIAATNTARRYEENESAKETFTEDALIARALAGEAAGEEAG